MLEQDKFKINKINFSRSVFCFLLGRNQELSINEIIIKFYSAGISFNFDLQLGEIYIFQTEANDVRVIEIAKELGGIKRMYSCKAAKSLYEFDSMLEATVQNGGTFALSRLGIDENDINQIETLIKSISIANENIFTFQNSSKILRRGIVDSKYSKRLKLGNEGLMIQIQRGLFLIGNTQLLNDSSEYKQIDENRENRLFSHGTSPKMSKIMINLLGIKAGERILDPFCGTGTVLLQAAKMGYKATGIELDEEVYRVCLDNMEQYDLTSDVVNVVLGSSETSEFSADGVVFEPYMGPFLKKIPTRREALNIISELNGLYLKVFKNLSKQITNQSRVVCILPGIPDLNGETHWTDEKVFLDAGFKKSETTAELSSTNENVLLVQNPILYESAGKNILKRKVYILYK
jgi:tRNA G10  N-methylase Trm11